MSYTTKTSKKWFPKIRDSALGLETTIRGDGAYDGDYKLLKEVWLIVHDGKRENYSTFAALWKALSATSDDLEHTLADSETKFLHLLYCGLDIGRPISHHPLWNNMDRMDDELDFRDHALNQGQLEFYVYESSDISDSCSWKRIARIRFNIGDGTFIREHIADLDRRR